MLEKSAAEAAACKSGRARALAGVACRLRFSSTQSSSLLRTKNDLSHLYRGRRLPPLSGHIKFPRREQHFCENVLGTVALRWGVMRHVGGRGSQRQRFRNVTKQKHFGIKSPNMLSGLTFLCLRKRGRTKNV